MKAFLFNNFLRVPLKVYVTSLGLSYKSSNMIACDAACLSLAREQAHLSEFGVRYII